MCGGRAEGEEDSKTCNNCTARALRAAGVPITLLSAVTADAGSAGSGGGLEERSGGMNHAQREPVEGSVLDAPVGRRSRCRVLPRPPRGASPGSLGKAAVRAVLRILPRPRGERRWAGRLGPSAA